MNPETKELLCRFDEPGVYEVPTGFDYLDLERRAKQVCEDIERLGVQVTFEGAVHNQDASFSIAILLHGFDPKEAALACPSTVRFSNFGNLATMLFIEQIPDAIGAEIRTSLSRHGFIYVCADELDCAYDGVMAERNDVFPTWWIRYFDWL